MPWPRNNFVLQTGQGGLTGPCAPCTSLLMKLTEYMKANGLSDADMAAKIGRHRVTVTRYRNEKTRPDWEALQSIIEATGGKVRPEDFFSRQKA